MAALNLKRDLGKISLWAWQWKMEFDAAKTEEILFSYEREKPVHPVLKLGEDVISPTSEHKRMVFM